jgi:hypothetical protein
VQQQRLALWSGYKWGGRSHRHAEASRECKEPKWMPSPWQREDCLMLLGWRLEEGLGWADERPNVPSAADWRRRNRLCSSIGQPRARILGSAVLCLAATGSRLQSDLRSVSTINSVGQKRIIQSAQRQVGSTRWRERLVESTMTTTTSLSRRSSMTTTKIRTFLRLTCTDHINYPSIFDMSDNVTLRDEEIIAIGLGLI